MGNVEIANINDMFSIATSEALHGDLTTIEDYEDYRQALAYEVSVIEKKQQEKRNEGIAPKIAELMTKFSIEKKDRKKFIMPKRPKDIKSEYVEILNKGYIPFPSATSWLLFSEQGTGKTLITIKNAIVYLLDNPTKQVFLWLAEDARSEIDGRFKKVCESMSIQNWEQFYNERVFLVTREDGAEQWATKQGDTVVPNAEYIATLADFVMENNIGFCAFDTLAKFFAMLSENSNDDMGVAVELFSKFASVTGASVCMIHHANKEGGFRGASVISGDPRYVIWIGKPKTLDKETGKKIDDPIHAGKRIKIGLEKQNIDVWRHCNIYDDDGMIDIPIVNTGNFEGAEVSVYKDDNIDTSRGYPIIIEDSNSSKIDLPMI